MKISQQLSDDDKLRMKVTRGVVATITGLDPVRQECLVTMGDPRHFHVAIHEARIPRGWLHDADVLIRQGLLDDVRWFGELGPENTMQISNPIDRQWRIFPEDTFTGSVHFVSQSPIGNLEISTKWDGCTHLWIEDENQEDGKYYQHICDLDCYIAYLQSCRNKARRYFGGEFGVAPVNNDERLLQIKAFQQEEQIGGII